MSVKRDYKVDVNLTIPARSLREAEHFARLAAASLDKRAAISQVQYVTYPDVWTFDSGYEEGDAS